MWSINKTGFDLNAIKVTIIDTKASFTKSDKWWLGMGVKLKQCLIMCQNKNSTGSHHTLWVLSYLCWIQVSNYEGAYTMVCAMCAEHEMRYI